MKRVLNREDAVLIVVDVQERLVPAIHPELYGRFQKNMKIVAETAGTLGLPTADGCGRATDLPGHLSHPEAIFEECDGPAAPGFQCGGRPIWSHI